MAKSVSVLKSPQSEGSGPGPPYTQLITNTRSNWLQSQHKYINSVRDLKRKINNGQVNRFPIHFKIIEIGWKEYFPV